jgi:hypothetical protein
MIRRLTLIAMSVLSLAGCDAPPRGTPHGRPELGANGRRDLTGTRANLGGEKNGQGYAAFDDFRDRKGAGLAFAGYGCVSNCADVIGGYQRARQQNIADARLCTGATWGELEGCVAFTQGFPTEISSVPPLRQTGTR